MSDKADKKKDKKKKGDGGANVVSVAAHPRAKGSIRRTRARTALVAFALVFLLSRSAGVSGQEAVMRAVAAGLVGNLVGWACALAVWRQIVVQEIRSIEEARRARVRARAEAMAAAAEAV
jgi:hypothetical protein